MMDNYKEDIVSKQGNLLNSVLYMLCWVLIVISGLIAMMLLQVVMYSFDLLSIALLLAFGGLAVLLYFKKDNLKLEYEYTFTNGTIDFAKVYRSAKRKELGCVNVNTIAACGHVAHDSFHRFLAQGDVEKMNWFLNRDGNLFYLYNVKDNKKRMIIFEPSEEMVSMIRNYVQVGAYQG